MRFWVACGMAVMALLPESIFGQVVLTPRDIPNRPGSAAYFWTATDAIDGIEVNVGGSGANQRWDLTAYRFDEVSFDTLIDFENAPGMEYFPAANRVMLSDQNALGLEIGTGYQYEVLADSGWYLLGFQGGGDMIGDLPLVFPTPLMILPMPAEYGAEWDIAVRYEIGFPAPDTLMGGVLDSVLIRFNVGGFASIDGWGVVSFSGGDVPALRQRISTGGVITVVGVGTLLNRRFEIELPYGFEISASQSYRWLSPAIGEVARITSMTGESEPNFNLASSIRVRRVVPVLEFPLPPISFGIVHPGNSGIGRMVIGNRGEGLGSIARIEFSGGLGAEIEPMNPLPFIIMPDTSAQLRFLWTPLEEKTLAGQSVALYHNDPEVDNPLVIDLQGATPEFATVKQNESAPVTFATVSAYPNPFNAVTLIRYSLPELADVSVRLYDVNGQEVATLIDHEARMAGSYSVALDGQDLPAGLYFVRLVAGCEVKMTKVLLVK